MYYLFKNKKVNKINDGVDDEEIIKVDDYTNKIDDNEIKVDEIIKDKNYGDIMPSLPIRVRKPIRKHHPKSFSLSIFSYKIIDASADNTLILGIGVGLGVGISIGVCLGALMTFSLTSTSK